MLHNHLLLHERILPVGETKTFIGVVTKITAMTLKIATIWRTR